jgi:hypothetical protein
LQNPSRHVELDIDIGADARDWSAIQASEKLKPVETELRRIEESVNEIVQELEYLRIREQKLRDTNESTNERVKWFALGTMGMLVGLGAWQVVYLRAYFRFVMPSMPLLMCLWGLLLILASNLGRSILSRIFSPRPQHSCYTKIIGNSMQVLGKSNDDQLARTERSAILLRFKINNRL